MIKTKAINPEAAETSSRIALLTGTMTTPERWYTDGEREYWHIAGGLAWPNEEDGAVVVVGVTRDAPPRFQVLEAETAEDVNGLMALAFDYKAKYQSDTKDLMQVLWGDWNRYQGLMSDFNLTKKDLYLSPPPEHNQMHAGLIYWRTIQSYLAKGSKRLFLNDHKVTSEIQSLIATGVRGKKAIHDFSPLIMALGFTVHALRAARHWELNASETTHIPTAGDPLAQTAYLEEITLRELFDDTGDPDDGLVNTL